MAASPSKKPAKPTETTPGSAKPRQNHPLEKGELTSASTPTPPAAQDRTATIIKLVGLIVFLLIIIGLTIAAIPYFPRLASAAGRDELIAQIQGAGPLGVGVVCVLQFLQIVVAFIPGEAVQLATGAIYGPLWGSVLAILAGLAGSVFVFFVVRKLGQPFVDAMIGKSKHQFKFLERDSSGLDALVLVLYLIPALPKDIFTYLFPLTKIKPVNFFVFSTIGRIPGVVVSGVIGSAAGSGEYTTAIVVAAIAVVIAVLVLIFRTKIMAAIDSHRSKPSS